MSFLNRNSGLIPKSRCFFRNFSQKLGNDSLEISPNFVNRNPRNLERIRIGYKPQGYHLEKPGRCYWHKLKLAVGARNITATVEHFENGDVLKASTSEWPIRKQLYGPTDAAAAQNLGRVMADRCLKSGLTELSCDIEAPLENGKVDVFLKAIQEGGVSLKEPEQYQPSRPWDQLRPEKPWEITE